MTLALKVNSLVDIDAAPGSLFALEDVATGDKVGDLAVRVNPDEPREIEVGFTLAPPHQGKGYATEVLTGLLDLVSVASACTG